MTELEDGSRNTVLLVEYEGQDILWLEPRDLELQMALEMLSSKERESLENRHERERFFFTYSYGNCMAFADGSVLLTGNRIDRNVLSAMLLLNDGRSWDAAQLQSTRIIRRPNIGNWVRLGVFIALGLCPFFGVWRRRSWARQGSA